MVTNELDTRWAAELAHFCSDSYAEYAAMEPGSATQVDSVLAADLALDCACLLHALNAPTHDLRMWISRAAFALGEVFRLRGTSPGVPLVVVTPDATHNPSGPAGPDYSLTNPRRGLLAMYAALVAGDTDLARRTASLVEGSTNAGEVGLDSSMGTAAEHHLARAVKALVLDDREAAECEADEVTGASQRESGEAAAVRAIAVESSRLFIDALNGLLEAHSREAADPRNRREPRYFLSLAALGLAVLATHSGVVEHRQLPTGYVHFPIQLIG